MEHVPKTKVQARPANVEASKVPPIGGCPQLPGTILRINIPAGAVINLLNIIEVSTPSGICLIVRLPILAGANAAGFSINSLVQSIEKAGGSIEFIQE